MFWMCPLTSLCDLLARLMGVCVLTCAQGGSLVCCQFCSHEITAHIQPLCSPSVSSQPCGSFTALFPVSLWRTEAHCPLILTTQHFTVICCHCLLHWVYKRSAHCHQKQLSHRYIIRFVKMNNTSLKKLLFYKTTHLCV